MSVENDSVRVENPNIVLSPTRSELIRAKVDAALVDAARIKLKSNPGLVELLGEHFDNGNNLVFVLTHQAHPDFLFGRRLAIELAKAAGHEISKVAYPGSSDLFPGGKLYKKDGRRMLALKALLGFDVYKMVQSKYNASDLGSAKINFRAFQELRKILTEGKKAVVGYFPEGGRGDKRDGVLREALDGIELLFARRGDTEGLIANTQVLAIPVSIQGTHKLMSLNPDALFRTYMSEGVPISIGQPFFARDIMEDSVRFAHPFAAVIGARLASLLPDYLRGAYGGKKFAPVKPIDPSNCL